MRYGNQAYRFFCAIGAAVLAMLPVGRAAAETPEQRGAYLVTTIAACGNCHTPKDAASKPIPGAESSGGFAFDIPPGHAVAANITPDPETGIGKWSDAQIVAALRDGRRPDGTTIGPPMPFEFYRGIADQDAAAIAAYIRSVTPIRHAVEKSQYKIALPPAYGPSVGHVEAPPRSDKVAYGGYLAGPLGHCMECHTPFKKPGQIDMSRLGAGGRDLPDPDKKPGGSVVSRNITPDPENGIGKWSDADIKRAITEGVRPDGAKLVRTMAFDWYARIAPADLDALVAYLRSLPPLK